MANSSSFIEAFKAAKKYIKDNDVNASVGYVYFQLLFVANDNGCFMKGNQKNRTFKVSDRQLIADTHYSLNTVKAAKKQLMEDRELFFVETKKTTIFAFSASDLSEICQETVNKLSVNHQQFVSNLSTIRQSSVSDSSEFCQSSVKISAVETSQTASECDITPPVDKIRLDKDIDIDIKEEEVVRRRKDEEISPTTTTSDYLINEKGGDDENRLAVENEFKEVMKVYEQTIGTITTPFQAQQLQHLVKDYGKEWVEEGLKEAAVSTNRFNFKYLCSILERWKNEGFKSNNLRVIKGGNNYARNNGEYHENNGTRKQREGIDYERTKRAQIGQLERLRQIEAEIEAEEAAEREREKQRQQQQKNQQLHGDPMLVYNPRTQTFVRAGTI